MRTPRPLCVDASVFVAGDAPDHRLASDARRFLEATLALGLVFHEPTLAVVEVGAAVARRSGDERLARRAAQWLVSLPGAVFHPLDEAAATIAVEVAATTRLRAADAVYAATALQTGSLLVTLDRELGGRVAGVVEAMTPDGWLERFGRRR